MFRSHRPPMQRSVAKSSRLGFTLIELIVVILVISILMAIVMPSIGNVFNSGREAQVVADIKNIEAGLAAFKLKYGIDPPSSFVISSDPATYIPASPADLANPAKRIGFNSRALMRQLWPSYEITNAAASTPGALLAANGVTGLDTTVYLNGAECLAFFLGGPGVLGDNVAPNGFSANPINPFLGGGSRVGPFLELSESRLVDVDENKAREIIDTLPNQTRPYQYFSSYDGKGYQLFGYDNTAGTDDDEVIVLNSSPTMQSVYLKNDTEWATAANRPSVGGVVGNYWNGKTYQIISPGLDGEYGVGGSYSSQDGIAAKSDAADTYRSREVRSKEADNITNFSSGSMKKIYTPNP
ncbi:type II secretion system protein [Planctomicrobium sp. SH527]|uniref:type II secretion system protein n=1 Tax=Planctomicrobium sp. SH527 TaxID=3448123 RepID=UPI003F5AE3F3